MGKHSQQKGSGSTKERSAADDYADVKNSNSGAYEADQKNRTEQAAAAGTGRGSTGTTPA